MIFLLATSYPAFAGASPGFAEWSILTPGGNHLRHQDGFKEDHGDCLTGSKEDGDADTVYVSNVSRWRYYQDHVVGESAQGFFSFDENSKDVRFFSTETELNTYITEKSFGAALSKWLDAADGWTEAWFPEEVWARCRTRQSNKPTSSSDGQTVDQKNSCKHLSKNNPALSHYPRTTWGQMCLKINSPEVKDQLPPERKQFFNGMCEFIFSLRK